MATIWNHVELDVHMQSYRLFTNGSRVLEVARYSGTVCDIYLPLMPVKFPLLQIMDRRSPRGAIQKYHVQSVEVKLSAVRSGNPKSMYAKS